MSKELTNLTEQYSDLLIQALTLTEPGDLLVTVLASIDDAHTLINKGLIR